MIAGPLDRHDEGVSPYPFELPHRGCIYEDQVKKLVRALSIAYGQTEPVVRWNTGLPKEAAGTDCTATV